MPVANPNLPVPKNPQVFVVPVRVTVDSDTGRVPGAMVVNMLKDPMERVLGEYLPDSLDRDVEVPVTFAFHGAVPEWASVYEVPSSWLDAKIEKVLQAKEAAVLDQDYTRADQLRTEGQELIAQRDRLAAMNLPPLLRTALAWALSYAKANAGDINEAYQESAMVTEEHYETLQKRFGLET